MVVRKLIGIAGFILAVVTAVLPENLVTNRKYFDQYYMLK
jgi:hypothetical protein